MIEETIAKVLVYKCTRCNRFWLTEEDADAHDCKPKEKKKRRKKK